MDSARQHWPKNQATEVGAIRPPHPTATATLLTTPLISAPINPVMSTVLSVRDVLVRSVMVCQMPIVTAYLIILTADWTTTATSTTNINRLKQRAVMKEVPEAATMEDHLVQLLSSDPGTNPGTGATEPVDPWRQQCDASGGTWVPDDWYWEESGWCEYAGEAMGDCWIHISSMPPSVRQHYLGEGPQEIHFPSEVRDSCRHFLGKWEPYR